MTSANAHFQHWRDTQVFYSQAILEAASSYEDGHGHLIIWHPKLGVLKTITLPVDPANISLQHP